MSKRPIHHAAIVNQSSVAQSEREKRSAPRVACTIPTRIELEGQRSTSTIHDLSATGAALVLDGAVELGQVMTLQFALPRDSSGDIRCAGLVRSVRRADGSHVCGVEFHNLDSSLRRTVAEWVRDELTPAPGDIARNHWRGEVHASEAFLVPDIDEPRKVLRWQPGMAELFKQVAQHLVEQDRVFVPYIGSDLSEGDRIDLEVVAPTCHFVFRVLAEVVWVQRTPSGAWGKGVGLRLAGMTPLDRHTLKAQLQYFKIEADRFR